MEIVEVFKNGKIMVKFLDNYKFIKETNYSNFKNGRLKNPYDKSVYGVGFLGYGDYTFKNDKKAYKVWSAMIERCYVVRENRMFSAYHNCEVCEEWHNFQNFAKWYYDNYYEVGSERVQLDKDILTKGNKIYSPENCIFVPQHINTLFEIGSSIRKYDLPIGISLSNGGRYTAKMTNKITNKVENLGTYDTIEEAFEVYKNRKEEYIKQIADLYKDKIPQRLYEAMYRYEVIK